MAGAHHGGPRRPGRDPPRRILRAGRVGRRLGRERHGPPPGPRPPRHHGRLGLRVLRRDGPRARDHGAPRGGRHLPHRGPAPHARAADAAVQWRRARGRRRRGPHRRPALGPRAAGPLRLCDRRAHRPLRVGSARPRRARRRPRRAPRHPRHPVRRRLERVLRAPRTAAVAPGWPRGDDERTRPRPRVRGGARRADPGGRRRHAPALRRRELGRASRHQRCGRPPGRGGAAAPGPVPRHHRAGDDRPGVPGHHLGLVLVDHRRRDPDG